MKRSFWLLHLLLSLALALCLPGKARALERIPDIQKDVQSIGNNSASFDIGQEHTWIIRGDAPEGIGEALVYEITDVLNYRLCYERSSPRVTLYTRAGTEAALREGTHYHLSEGRTEEGSHLVDCFTVSLTAEGMDYVAENLGTGELKPELRVCFSAAINRSTAMGSTIPNDAHLLYVNHAGEEYRIDSDIPEVHTGGINLINQNEAGEGLPGAVFLLARDVTQEDWRTLPVEVLFVEGKDRAVVYVDFFTRKDLSGEKSSQVQTDGEGKASLYGLAYGTYYLIQIQGPEGYSPLPEPIPVQINETSHLTAADGWRTSDDKLVDNTRHILQSPFPIPNTGDPGIYGIGLLGVACLFSAVCLLRQKRR